jgi:hypothetical protein
MMRRFRSILCAAAALLPLAAVAQIAATSPPVQALREGRASALPPEGQVMQSAIDFIRGKTGSGGDVTVEFFRIARFETQQACGRVGFGLYQAATKTFWGQFGGQVNICEDGGPPRRECKGVAGLVPPDARCPDGSAPTDTPEVGRAFAQAVADGGMTAEQFQKKSAASPAAPSAGSRK